MALRVVRLFRCYRHKDRDGTFHEGLFAVGKSKFFQDYLLHDESDPLIPGTDVPRARRVWLGPTSSGLTEDEIRRVIEGLQRWHAAQRAAKRARRAERAGAEVAAEAAR
jgi:hypothetical protein